MRAFSPLILLALLSCGDKETDSATSGVIVDDTAADAVVDADGDGDGYSVDDGDCDDTDAAVSPGAEEVCNDLDDDCDGSIDEDVTTTGYLDADGDGYGDETDSIESCELPTGYVESAGDCDDTDALFNPGADESDCTDPNDYNCDGSVGYDDADSDGYAACEDCDDADAGVSPGAEEVCNSVDDDCDGDTDDDDDSIDLTTGSVFYEDYDGDSYGNPDEAVEACEAPDGYAEAAGDCDDTDALFNPDADEDDCTDPNDYNCDGSVGYEDADSDGYAACEDCDDSSAAVSPLATEICNGVDDDCDGDTDDDDSGLDSSTTDTWYADSDGDSYGSADYSWSSCDAPSGYVASSNDCDDSNAAINPGASEVCDSADTDEDCSGYADDDDGGVDSAGKSTWYADADSDGYGNATYTWSSCDAPTGYAATGDDCDDSNAAVSPGGTEVCDSADTDEDCDGTADDDDSNVDSAGKTSWYRDSDEDGFGDASASTATCDPPAGYTSSATDCDDADAAVNPDAEEVCNTVDDDCDGTTDGASASDASAWYADTDSDGYGDASAAAIACTAPSGYIADSADCDDGDAAISPDAEEVCNTVDDDCDGDADEDDAADALTWYADDDGDGYGDPDDAVAACTQPTGYVSDNTDCDDTDASAYAGAGDSGSTTFSYTGSAQTFTVPDCIDEITITAYGAEGQSASTTSSSPGMGGMAEGTLSVSAGDVLYVYVGGADGYNGGGDSWTGSSQTCNGGGASDVREGGTSMSDRIIVAGGGGGVSGESAWGDGGDGGAGSCGSNYCGGGGGAGYPSATGTSGSTSGGSGTANCHGGAGGGGGLSGGGGGASATCYSGATAGTGTLGVGGAGSAASSGCCASYGAAGGGGGYYGGGGVAGGCCGGGGAGGGSSWTGALSDPAFTAGAQSGDGEVIISW